MRRCLLLVTFFCTVVTVDAQTRVAAPELDRDRIGYGYFTATGTFSEAPCVKGDVRPSGPALTTWKWVEASRLDELKQKVTESFKANLRYGPFSAGGSYLGLQESESSSYAFTVIGRTSAIKSGEGYDLPTFTPFAVKRLGTAKFQQVCGDKYVKATFAGGAIYVVAQLTSQDKTEQRTFSSSLQGAVEGKLTGSASTEAERYLNSVMKERGATIRVVRAGPLSPFGTSASTGNLITDAQTQLAQLRSYASGKFLEELTNADNRLPIEYELGSYTVLDEWKPVPETEGWADDAYAKLNAISQYLADLRAIRSGVEYFGPIDVSKIEMQDSEWTTAGKQLTSLIERCERGEPGCDKKKIRSMTVPEKAPMPGKRLIAAPHSGPRFIDIGHVANTNAISGSEGYKRPLMIRVIGEWAYNYPGDDRVEKMCGFPLAETLVFYSKDITFVTATPAGRAAAQKITNADVRVSRNAKGFAEGSDEYLVRNWPPNRELVLHLQFPNATGHNATCPLDPPAVEIWEHDDRINVPQSDPIAAPGTQAPPHNT